MGGEDLELSKIELGEEVDEGVELVDGVGGEEGAKDDLIIKQARLG